MLKATDAVTAYEQALDIRKNAQQGDADKTEIMKKPSAKTAPCAKKAPSSKAAPKTAPKSILKQPAKGSPASTSTWTKAKGGWKVEVRVRGSGTQTDAYYHARDGKQFRIKGDAVKYGFKG